MHHFATPDLFQVVVLADVGLHDVGHSGSAIHDDPFAVAFAFDAGLGETGILDGLADAGGQGFGLAVGRAAGDDDALKQRRKVLGVEHHNVLPLHILQAVHNGALEFLDIGITGLGFAHGDSVR